LFCVFTRAAGGNPTAAPTQRKKEFSMLTALLPAALLAASQLTPMDTTTALPGERLTSAQIGQVLSSSYNVPPNCWVESFLGQCSIICDEGGALAIYDCGHFG
jgi:hypothetical protein